MIALVLAAALSGELDAAALQKLVAEQKGRPVVVTLWATWCGPCVKEFPELQALATRRSDVAFLSVSIDDREDAKALESFVAARKPPFPVYRKADGKDQAFIDGVDKDWSGVVPATLVYDATGRRVALLQGEHPVSDIEKAVAKAGP